MRDRLPHAARITIAVVKAGAVATIATAGISMAPSDSPASGVAGLQTASTQRMFDRHGCSTTGFDDGSQPTSAVVSTARGRLRFVDFETGWDVFTRHGEATLVAVCLDEPPVRQESEPTVPALAGREPRGPVEGTLQ